MTERIDIDKSVSALIATAETDEEKVVLPLLAALLASGLKDLRRAADALEVIAKRTPA